MGEVERFAALVRVCVEDAVERNAAKGVLLSGGLDTSILVALVSRTRKLTAFTVALEGAPSPDVHYARLVAEKFGVRHVVRFFSFEEALKAAYEVVRVLGVFDPMEVRNSIPIYIALIEASKHVECVMTGDGADELFAGYSFLFELGEEELERKLRSMWSVMSFSSKPLGACLGVGVSLPYLDPVVVDCASKVPARLKVRQDGETVWGKWILRKAFEDVLPREVAWRTKTPIEVGCGTCTLPKILGEKVGDEEFSEKRKYYLEKDGVELRDKEHLTYYEVYRDIFGPPREAVKSPEGKTCPHCKASIPVNATYCKICGGYPIP
ncbi:MAG: asparagine synthase-related protein [Candidatus Jordarchaeales archaeon]